MTQLSPIYTASNCGQAYQLNWSLSVFWKQSIGDADWLPTLQQTAEPDGIRVLQHRFLQPLVSQFLVSTRPHVAPVDMVRLVKGRLQHAVRSRMPKAFQGKYSFSSVGSARREAVENYVQSQASHHRAGAGVDPYQIVRDVDLSPLRASSHGRFRYNLHIVFGNDGRWIETRNDVLGLMRDMILRVSAARGHLLSSVGIMPDHIHMTLGCPIDAAPADVALCYMNNLAYACGLRQVFSFGFYTGTFGEYDLGLQSLRS